MSEVDFTKEVEIQDIDGEWVPFRVLHYDTQWPRWVYGIRHETMCPARYCMTIWNFRNTPPPPPEVWIVWEHFGRGDWYVVGRYDNQQTADIVVKAVGNSVVKRHAQKVVCDAPR